MYLLGLCGRSGSGKSTVCRFLKQRGVYCIDADKVCHRVYETDMECVNELCDSFGKGILSDGKLDRTLLGKAVYSVDGGIATLNTITHKYIIAAILAEAKVAFANGCRFVVVDAPVLFESGLNAYCDATIAVIADDARLLDRLKKRDGLDSTMLEKRLRSQKNNKFLMDNCTAVIKNCGSEKDLRLNTYRAMLGLQLKLGIIKPYKGVKRYALKPC